MYMSDILLELVNILDETVEKNNTSTEKACNNKAEVSKETLKALISEEVAKQVGDKYLCLSKKVKDLQKKIDELDTWTEATDEELYGIEDELEDIWDTLDFEEYEKYCDDNFEEDEEDFEEDPDAELEAIVKMAKEEAEKHDDYSGEEFLSKVAKNHFGLDSYTISDGDKSALVIPLDNDFDLMHYFIKQEVSTLISEINKRASK